MKQAVFGGDRRLVLESVGTANAAALRAVRQLVPGTIEEVARLVYQAPSELAVGLRGDAAAEVAALLGNLGFDIKVAGPGDAVNAGKGEFEIALVVNDIGALPAVIAEAAAFLGTDLTTARRVVCRTPAVILSNMSEATVAAVRRRFTPLGVDIDVSRLDSARYYAIVSLEAKGLRRALLEVIRGVASEADVVEGNGALTVSDLSLQQAQALWERLQRTGARASICNRDLERYDIALTGAADSEPMSELLMGFGIPARVVSRVLRSLPVIIQQNVSHATMPTLLDRIANAGGQAIGLPYSFQRFTVAIDSVKDRAAAAKLLVTLGDVSETAAAVATGDANGACVGSFTRTTALWLRHALHVVGTDARVELI